MGFQVYSVVESVVIGVLKYGLNDLSINVLLLEKHLADKCEEFRASRVGFLAEYLGSAHQFKM